MLAFVMYFDGAV